MFLKKYSVVLWSMLLFVLTACGGGAPAPNGQTIELPTRAAEASAGDNIDVDPAAVAATAESLQESVNAAAEAGESVAVNLESVAGAVDNGREDIELADGSQVDVDALAATAESVQASGGDAGVNIELDTDAVLSDAQGRGGNLDAAQMSDLQAKLANIDPDSDGSVTVNITDDELTAAINQAQGILIENGQTPIFQNAAFTFTNGQIYFTSDINSEQFTGTAEIVFIPYLTNNVLQLDVVSATLNDRRLPPAVLQPIEDTINMTLQEAFSQLPAGVTLDQVVVQEGVLVITGSVNQ